MVQGGAALRAAPPPGAGVLGTLETLPHRLLSTIPRCPLRPRIEYFSNVRREVAEANMPPPTFANSGGFLPIRGAFCGSRASSGGGKSVYLSCIWLSIFLSAFCGSRASSGGGKSVYLSCILFFLGSPAPLDFASQTRGILHPVPQRAEKTLSAK